MKRTDRILRLCAALLLLMIALSLSAQEPGDSIFTFRFHVGRNEFYSPGLNNGPELKRLYECVDNHKELIKSQKMILYVDGYSDSDKSITSNYAIAKTRSNRVKSELITNKGLKERNFVTHNHVGTGNYVLVQLAPAGVYPEPVLPGKQPEPLMPIPVEVPPIEETPSKCDSIPDLNSVIPNIPEIPEIPEATRDSVTLHQPTDSVPQDVFIPVSPKRERGDSRFALKTNLLFYAILMPNLEVEWKCADKWSVALEGQVAWYGKENPHRVYRIATIIPEGRYWVIERSRWKGMYVGVFGGIGEYDLANGGNGHEGEGVMAGASVGYMWPISKHLSLDASLGAGYMRLRDKEYRPLDGHFLYQLTRKINYFGPLRLKLSLVWRIPR